jgi:Tfp pilus assembly protein PilZ
VGASRLELHLSSHSEWLKVFDPRDWTIFVPTEPAGETVDNGSTIRVDLEVDGWRVVLRGTVVGMRDDPAGVVVALNGNEREKINYLNGFVRGGLLNLREKRRLPIKLSVTYGAIEGPATTSTKDINEEGLFLFTDKPLPETSQIHMLVQIPGRADPLSVIGKVSHTIVSSDEEAPGMGVVFELDDAQRAAVAAIVKELEQLMLEGKLPLTTLE